MKATKKEITALQEFYPATIKALGGPEGVQRFLAQDGHMPERASRIFHKENDEVLNRQERLEELSETSEVLKELCDGC